MKERRVNYRLIEASSEDEAWLDDLRRRAYEDLFNVTWGGWDEERHLRQFSDSIRRDHISIIEVDGTRVGMIQLLDHGDAVVVAEIQIDPSHQNQGVGASVLGKVISDASAQGRDVRLSVGLTNERAIKLYERMGFSVVGQSETHCHMRYREAG